MKRPFKDPQIIFELSGQQQWAVDKQLGILDWDGKNLTPEDKMRFKNHYNKFKKEVDKCLR